VFTVDFGAQKGGEHSFSSLAELYGFAISQSVEWNSWASDYPSSESPIQDITDHWTTISNVEYGAEERSDGENLDHIRMNIQRYKFVIVFDSPIGLALREVVEELGIESGGMALLYITNPDKNIAPINGPLTLQSLRGIIAIERKLAGFTNDGSAIFNKAIAQFNQKLEKLDGRGHALISEFSKIFENFNRNKIEMEEKFSSSYEDCKMKVFDQIEDFKSKWTDLYASYSEHLKIESSVLLWKERERNYKELSESGWKWIWIIGISGFLGAVAWAVGAFELSGWLFKSALINSSPTYVSGSNGLRLTFHFELIVASAATLFYLTMYLWAMRLIIRNYVVNEHLKIDASGRASMAETYLALIKESAASDADRAIVLSSLFRPVVDGMVKDDGPPAVTPAAIMASLAQGKN